MEYFLLFSGIIFVFIVAGYYFWFLLYWPVVNGRVSGIVPRQIKSSVRTTKPKNILLFEMEFNNTLYKVSNQSLYFHMNLSPRKNMGESILMRVNPIDVRKSCASRPVFEGVIAMSLAVSFSALVFFTIFEYQILVYGQSDFFSFII